MSNVQELIGDFQREKGFDTVAITQQFLQMHGEVNEAYEAWRRTDIENLAEELADVCVYVYGIANAFDINLEEAIETKLKKNAARQYTEIDGQIYEVGKADTPKIEE